MATQIETPTFNPIPEKPQPEASVRAPSKVPLLLFALVAFVGLGAVVVWAVTQAFGEQETDAKGVLTHSVARIDMLITVVDDGNLESASNVDIKCQVAGGGTILWIVEDGKRVDEGDLLVQLDTSLLEDELQQQKIVYSQAEATKIQSQEDFEAAEIAVREFQEGTYLQQLQVADADIQIATVALKSAQDVLDFTESMVRKGFATPLQLEADRSAVQQAQLNLEAAETSKRVLTDFTFEKTMKTLVAAREAAGAQFRSAEASLELEETKLARLEQQIANSVIYAPQTGMVVYANDNSRRRGSSEVEIAEGAQVREGQNIIRLPDLANMQAKMTVHESKVDQIEPGMPARITILGQNFTGHVVSIANQPEPGSWFSSNVKEYATSVAIDGQTSGLRPGMTASVVVLIEEIKDALAVPVSAIVEKRGKFYCYLRVPNAPPEEREVIVGRSNESYVQIIDGVKEGDVVLRNPRAVVPEARDDTPLEERSTERSQFGERVDVPPSGQGPPGGRGGYRPGANGAQGPGGRPQGDPVARFMQNDADGDGKLSRDEVPEWARGFLDFDTVDADGDGLLDRSELRAGLPRRGNGGGPGGGGPGGGEPRSGRPGGGFEGGGGPRGGRPGPGRQGGDGGNAAGG